MGKGAEVVLTGEEAQFLLERTAVLSLPQELGENKFDVADQAIANDEMANLLRCLKSYSPRMQRWGKDRQLLFGDLGDWEAKEVSRPDASGKLEVGTEFTHLAGDKEYKVRLTPPAVNGAMWALFLSLYPICKMGNGLHKPVYNSIAANVCWPIAEKLKKVTALRAFLKMDITKSRNWADDPEPVEVESPGRGSMKAVPLEVIR